MARVPRCWPRKTGPWPIDPTAPLRVSVFWRCWDCLANKNKNEILRAYDWPISHA